VGVEGTWHKHRNISDPPIAGSWRRKSARAELRTIECRKDYEKHASISRIGGGPPHCCANGAIFEQKEKPGLSEAPWVTPKKGKQSSKTISLEGAKPKKRRRD